MYGKVGLQATFPMRVTEHVPKKECWSCPSEEKPDYTAVN